MKILVWITVICSALSADAMEEVRLKIERALACNAKITNVSEVQIATLEASTQYRNHYYAEGVYKSVSSIGGNKFGFSFGDEFHPSSGTFEALIDKDLKVKKIYWKIGMAKGYVVQSCLSKKQRRF